MVVFNPVDILRTVGILPITMLVNDVQLDVVLDNVLPPEEDDPIEIDEPDSDVDEDNWELEESDLDEE